MYQTYTLEGLNLGTTAIFYSMRLTPKLSRHTQLDICEGQAKNKKYAPSISSPYLSSRLC